MTAVLETASIAGSGASENVSPLRTLASVSTTCRPPGGGPHSSGGAGPKITMDGLPYADAR
jgi:hypothetical protein